MRARNGDAHGIGSIEQAGDAFLPRRARDRLGHQRCDREHADVFGALDRVGGLDLVGDHQRLELRIRDLLDGPARQHTMRDISHHFGGALIL